MAESICRTLRDGGFKGEQAPALTIEDTILCPLGPFVLDHILCQVCSFILSRRSQSKVIVLVALSRSPIYYEELLKRQGYDVASSCTWSELSEKERNDREKVFLPFEHQGNGKPLDAGEEGMKNASVERVQAIDSSKGEIVYFRDSDDEMPDSDEDPDEDLDI